MFVLLILDWSWYCRILISFEMVFFDVDRSSLVCALSAHVLLGAGFDLIFFFLCFSFQLLLTLPTISLFSLSATNSSEFSVDCETHAFLSQSFRVPFTVRNSKTGPELTFVFYILLDWIGSDVRMYSTAHRARMFNIRVVTCKSGQQDRPSKMMRASPPIRTRSHATTRARRFPKMNDPVPNPLVILAVACAFSFPRRPSALP